MLKRKLLPHLSDDELKQTLLRMHNDELKSVLAMAKELNTSRDTLYNWAKYFGIQLRSGSEANKVRFSKTSEEERKAITMKANKAMRGRKMSVESKTRRAFTNSERAVMSLHEKTFAIELIRADVYDFVFSYPVHIFNVDFALPAHKIAVEVDGGNWHSTERKQAQDMKKEDYLTSEGWTVLRWSSDKPIHPVITALFNLLN